MTMKMNLEDKIAQEFNKHVYFYNSFKRCQYTITNEHEKNGKKYSFSMMSWEIDKDRNKRAKRIIKLIKENN